MFLKNEIVPKKIENVDVFRHEEILFNADICSSYEVGMKNEYDLKRRM